MIFMKRTKIVCTLGPSTDDESVLSEMIRRGMNVARLNLSHGTLDEHLGRMVTVRRLARDIGTHIAIMFDTRGPDLRVGNFESGSVKLAEGNTFILSAEPCEGTSGKVSVNWPGLIQLLKPGATVFLHDGLLELKVIESDSNRAECTVIKGGVLKSRKGINIPGLTIPLPVLTNEDIEDLKAGIKFPDDESGGIDFISASFVDSADDIELIRNVIGDADTRIIAKIESAEGVKNLDEIIDAADGVMVARGDLGIEIPPEEVPGVQKRMIRLCREAHKPVITATEMLESMTHAPRPTRAEITDVANAVLDGTSAVMLSGETAVGEYPVEAVGMMARICHRAEQDFVGHSSPDRPSGRFESVRGGIVHAGCQLAEDIQASAIICVTDSGETAGIFSHLRPPQPVLACTPDIRVVQRLSLYWGVIPVVVDRQGTVEEMLEAATELGKSRNLLNEGDKIVFTGNLSGSGGETNLLAAVEV
jgi:pyruvate kinase